MWASMATLFTSSALFILLNIVIVIIVFISRLSSSSHTNNHVTPLARALDRVKSIDFSLSNYNFTPNSSNDHSQSGFYNPIQRVKSINFSFNNFFHHQQQEEEHQADYRAPPSILERVKSIDFTSIYNRLDSGRVNPAAASEAEVLQTESRGSDPVQLKTSKSDQGMVTQRKAKKMKKSASELFRREEGEEELERRRPATVKPEKSKKAVAGETSDVDAKADDFINRFKQQLKLQRLDSILRYKEMLNPK